MLSYAAAFVHGGDMTFRLLSRASSAPAASRGHACVRDGVGAFAAFRRLSEVRT